MQKIAAGFAEHKTAVVPSQFAGPAVGLERGAKPLANVRSSLPAAFGDVGPARAFHALSFRVTRLNAPYEVITRIQVWGKGVYGSRARYLPRTVSWIDRLRRVEIREGGVIIAASGDLKGKKGGAFDVVLPFAGFLAEAELEVRLVIEVNQKIPDTCKTQTFPWIRDDRWSVVVEGGDVKIDKFAWAATTALDSDDGGGAE